MPRVTAARVAVPPPGLTEPQYRQWLRDQRRAQAAAQAPTPFEIVRAANVTPERIRWVWPGRLPLGKLVILDGDPGTGKSTLTLDMAARVSRGLKWPDGARCPKGNALILSAEDDAADTIRPRLESMGADLQRVVIVKGYASLPDHLTALENQITAERARLVIIDVLMAYLGDDVDTRSDQAMRRVLSRLAALAAKSGACIIAIRHFNKATGQRAVYRGGGSIGIIGQARAAFAVATHPADPSKHVFAPIKVNVAARPAALVYRLVNVDLHNGIRCVRIEWDSDSCDLSADDLVSDPGDDKKAYQTDAARWLDNYMEECKGEAKAADVLREGAAAGFNKNVLHHARQSVGVKTGRPSFSGPWLWTCEKYGSSQCHGDPGTE